MALTATSAKTPVFTKELGSIDMLKLLTGWLAARLRGKHMEMLQSRSGTGKTPLV